MLVSVLVSVAPASGVVVGLHTCGPPMHLHEPPMHMDPGSHFTPHAPQFDRSIMVLAHEPPQFTVTPVHVVTHSPPRQARAMVPPSVAVVPQALLHMPQLRGSLVRFTQTPLQDISPGGHWQAPPRHSRPAVQVMPQPPQFSSSVFVSTQPPAHAVRPIAQVIWQVPFEQTDIALQVVPQAPQLAGSLLRLTH